MFLPRTRTAIVTVALLALVLSSRTPAADPVQTDVLKYLPADANVAMIVRMDRVLVSDGFKKLRKAVPMIDKEFESGFKKEFGFEVGNVVQMTAGFNTRMPEGASAWGNVTVVQLKSPVKLDAFLKAQSEPRNDGGKPTTFTAEKVGKFTMYVPSKESKRGNEAFCAIDDKTFLGGKPASVKAVLEGDAKSGLNESLRGPQGSRPDGDGGRSDGDQRRVAQRVAGRIRGFQGHRGECERRQHQHHGTRHRRDMPRRGGVQERQGCRGYEDPGRNGAQGDA